MTDDKSGDDFNDYARDSKGYSEAQQSPPPYSKASTSNNPDQTDPKHFPKPPQRTNAVASGSGAAHIVLPPPPSWPSLPPPCNYLIERRPNASLSGTWHVDTALAIPEPLLPPFSAFDGSWNHEAQKSRKNRDKEQKRRDGWWSKRINGDLPPLPLVKEARPNLMLHSTNGSVNGKVYLLSSGGVMRPGLIVAQGYNGTVTLTVNATQTQQLQIHATSINGSVTVKIPSSYQGAVTMSTINGGIRISDGIKAKSTTFTSTANNTRFFVGDWQAAGFGVAPDTSAFGSHAVAGPSNAPPRDSFATWSGPMVHLASTNGSVHLLFVDEDLMTSIASGISKAVRNVMNGIFGN